MTSFALGKQLVLDGAGEGYKGKVCAPLCRASRAHLGACLTLGGQIKDWLIFAHGQKEH